MSNRTTWTTIGVCLCVGTLSHWSIGDAEDLAPLAEALVSPIETKPDSISLETAYTIDNKKLENKIVFSTDRQSAKAALVDDLILGIRSLQNISSEFLYIHEKDVLVIRTIRERKPNSSDLLCMADSILRDLQFRESISAFRLQEISREYDNLAKVENTRNYRIDEQD